MHRHTLTHIYISVGILVICQWYYWSKQIVSVAMKIYVLSSSKEYCSHTCVYKSFLLVQTTLARYKKLISIIKCVYLHKNPFLYDAYILFCVFFLLMRVCKCVYVVWQSLEAWICQSNFDFYASVWERRFVYTLAYIWQEIIQYIKIYCENFLIYCICSFKIVLTAWFEITVANQIFHRIFLYHLVSLLPIYRLLFYILPYAFYFVLSLQYSLYYPDVWEI